MEAATDGNSSAEREEDIAWDHDKARLKISRVTWPGSKSAPRHGKIKDIIQSHMGRIENYTIPRTPKSRAAHWLWTLNQNDQPAASD